MILTWSPNSPLAVSVGIHQQVRVHQAKKKTNDTEPLTSVQEIEVIQ
jgi:hypothetical protein